MSLITGQIEFENKPQQPLAQFNSISKQDFLKLLDDKEVKAKIAEIIIENLRKRQNLHSEFVSLFQ